MSSDRLTRNHLLTIAGFCVFALLIYVQFRAWGSFDWRTFLAQTRRARIWPFIKAVILIYISYIVLIARWKVFLHPLRRSSLASLFAPTVIGFTGLVLLGRLGELIRPYLLARSERVSFASQMAIWFVERLFDLGACVTMVGMALMADPTLNALPYFRKIREATSVIATVLLATCLVAFLLRSRLPQLSGLAHAACHRVAGNFGWRAADDVEAFARELFTSSCLLKVTGLSLLLWSLNAVACWEVIHAYPYPLDQLGAAPTTLVMGFGILGSVLQLPAVGGGSQLATIAALAHVFGMPKELAVSCGIALWLVMFASIVPAGLILAHRAELSLHGLSRETAAPDNSATPSTVVE
jgi:glycosyltransferase 2 family protein